jgi:hypothetical protein
MVESVSNLDGYSDRGFAAIFLDSVLYAAPLKLSE